MVYALLINESRTLVTNSIPSRNKLCACVTHTNLHQLNKVFRKLLFLHTMSGVAATCMSFFCGKWLARHRTHKASKGGVKLPQCCRSVDSL